MEIKDSGNRREFGTGAVRDIQEGKGRCDLMPLDVVAMVTKYRDSKMSEPVLEFIGNFKETSDIEYLALALVNFSDCAYKDVDDMMLELAKHFEQGAVKYGENNWQKGIPVHCYIDSAVRHYLKYRAGWTDEPHDRAFVWNLVCCIWTWEHKPELNDYSVGDRDGKM